MGTGVTSAINHQNKILDFIFFKFHYGACLPRSELCSTLNYLGSEWEQASACRSGLRPAKAGVTPATCLASRAKRAGKAGESPAQNHQLFLSKNNKQILPRFSTRIPLMY